MLQQKLAAKRAQQDASDASVGAAMPAASPAAAAAVMGQGGTVGGQCDIASMHVEEFKDDELQDLWNDEQLAKLPLDARRKLLDGVGEVVAKRRRVLEAATNPRG
eukprot:5575600-Karenia_brevis.AAC.1